MFVAVTVDQCSVVHLRGCSGDRVAHRVTFSSAVCTRVDVSCVLVSCSIVLIDNRTL